MDFGLLAEPVTGPAEGRTRWLGPGMTKTPARAGVLLLADVAGTYFFPSPPNFFWKRERRPPRSIRCCCPPVQAGCDFGSMSRASVSPFFPQVVRVVNSVPSVILTVTV